SAGVNAEAFHFLRSVAASQPDIETTVADHIDKCQFLGHANGIVERQHDDARPQANRCGGTSNRCERELRRRADTVVTEMMFGGPDRREAESLGRLHEVKLFAHHVMLGTYRPAFEEVKGSEFH